LRSWCFQDWSSTTTSAVPNSLPQTRLNAVNNVRTTPLQAIGGAAVLRLDHGGVPADTPALAAARSGGPGGGRTHQLGAPAGHPRRGR